MATFRLHPLSLPSSIICLLLCACSHEQAPVATFRPERAPLIIVLDDRSGTIDQQGIVKADAFFYNEVANGLQTFCPGSILAVVLCGNPQPEAKSSFRFDADTFRIFTPGDDANLEERYYARLSKDSLLLARNQRREAFIARIDRHIFQYQPNGVDVTLLDDALLRVRNIIDSPIHAHRPKLVVILSDGINENAFGEAIPFARKFTKNDDDASLQIVLNSWENSDISIFEHATVPLQRTESLPDAQRCISEFIRQNKI
ncbi:MAG: hypothetical protein JNM22_06390 [Saprospiraceae bacterium]|nr:hypothetical protein [Saprospiraceae bacterium]